MRARPDTPQALALYRGDLLDSPDVPTYWWLYNGHALATTLRSDYRRQQREVRLLLADLCGAGASAPELTRAQELYAGLTAEDPEDERLWTALFKVHGRRGDSLGLEVAARRLRMALVELGKGDDPDSVVLPPALERILKEMRTAVGQQSTSAVA